MIFSGELIQNLIEENQHIAVFKVKKAINEVIEEENDNEKSNIEEHM